MTDVPDDRHIAPPPTPADDASPTVGGSGSAAAQERPGPAQEPPNARPDEPQIDDVTTAERVVRRAVDGASDVIDTVGNAGRTVGHLASPVVRSVRPRVGAAYRRWKNRQAARVARLHALNREPLPNLYEVHPEARLAPIRELGLQTIPVAEIVGTAVEGPVQRGRDFLPPPPLRTQNWVARWQRILKATESLAVLPPIEVLKAAGAYWVVDGHNRVAAALYTHQVAIDALVSAVRLPGDPIEVPGSLASMLSREDELGGVGRFVSRHTFEPPLADTDRAGTEHRAAEPGPEAAADAALAADAAVAANGGVTPDGGTADGATARDGDPADTRGAEGA